MPLPKSTKPVKRTLMRDQVYETLLDLIIHQKLAPEEKLLDHELSERLGVSRTPVREALRRLEDEGFVATAANQWTRVAPIDLTEANELYPIISALECLAISTAMNLKDEAFISKLEEVNRNMDRAIKTGKASKVTVIDTEFHDVLCSGSTNKENAKILKNLKLKMRRTEQIFFAQEQLGEGSVKEHDAIIGALHDGDVDSIQQMLRQHWSEGLARRKVAGVKYEERQQTQTKSVEQAMHNE